MKYAIIGSGDIGTALARTFAKKNIEVALANSRGPETLASLAKEIGSNVSPQSVQDAIGAEMIFLAVPFAAHRDVAKLSKDWKGKIVVDATNAFGVASQELGGHVSSEVVAQAFAGARLVKAFNHLPAEQLGTNPSGEGQQQVVFVSSNDADASATVAALPRSSALLPSRSGNSPKAECPSTSWTGSLAGFCFRTWRSSADCCSVDSLNCSVGRRK